MKRCAAAFEGKMRRGARKEQATLCNRRQLLVGAVERISLGLRRLLSGFGACMSDELQQPAGERVENEAMTMGR